jgi:FkbM family methyltransferase
MKLIEVELIKTINGNFFNWNKDIYINESLKKYNGWENEIIEECKKFIKPNSNVIEIGSHIGTHTIPLSKLNYSGFIFAFEMQRFIYQLLITNVIFNGRSNVYAFNEAVSDKTEDTLVREVNYGMDPQFNSGNVKIQEIHEEGYLPLRKTTIDDKFYFLKSLDLIKIDVECHELNVLKGALKTIQKFKPVIITEFHEVKTIYTDGNKQEIKNLLPNYSWKDITSECFLNNRKVFGFNMIGIPNETK